MWLSWILSWENYPRLSGKKGSHRVTVREAERERRYEDRNTETEERVRARARESEEDATLLALKMEHWCMSQMNADSLSNLEK